MRPTPQDTAGYGQKVSLRRQTEASLIAATKNLALARQKSPCLRPWHGRRHSEIIRRLIWQWEWSALKTGLRECSGRALARRLGVSRQTVSRIRRTLDPAELQMIVFKQGMATMTQLRQAEAETQRLRQADVLRRRVSWHTKGFLARQREYVRG
jgi:hypothetical protein